MKGPQTLQQAIQFFSEYENCRQFMIAVRWADGKVRCPNCGSEKVTYLEKARLYFCSAKHPKQKFSLKIGTVFEDSPISLEKWLPATWLLANCKNGISSYEIASDIGVTQKSAWFMMHRIRLAMQTGTFVKLGGPGSEVESDETFIGGKAKNMSASRRAQFRVARETSMGDAALVNKTAVWGVLDREQRKVRATVVPKVNREALQTAVLDQVAPGSKIYTDEAKVYRSLPKEFTQGII